MKVQDIKISDFDYKLEDERIAKHPLGVRDSCKLLVSRAPEEIEHGVFSDVVSLLPSDSLLVCNDTRVINARIKFTKATGSRVEVFLLEPIMPEDYALMFQSRGACRWSCLVGNLKRWKEGRLSKELRIGDKLVTLYATRGESRSGNSHDILFEWDDRDVTFAEIIEAAGFIPIPPYLNRESEVSDKDDYQTVYAHYQGSVAAPTAGLHFTPALMEQIREKGVDIRNVTLHVGAGTFQPVKSEDIGGHPMHTETFSVTRELVRALISSMKSGKTITAVGTTTVRTLESLPVLGKHLMEGDGELNVTQWEAYSADENVENPCEETVKRLEAIADYMDKEGLDELTASTSIMIAPGFGWRVVDNIITNFHQPQSTLLLLVSSFLGDAADEAQPRWRRIYDEALKGNYRFLSYGDACFFSR